MHEASGDLVRMQVGVDSVGLRTCPGVCISNQLPGAVGFANMEPHLEQQGPTLDCME